MNWLRTIKEYIRNRPKIKKIIGSILIIIGLIALVTPLTPGSWLVIIGLELLGIRILFFDKFKFWEKRTTSSEFLQKKSKEQIRPD